MTPLEFKANIIEARHELEATQVPLEKSLRLLSDCKIHFQRVKEAVAAIDEACSILREFETALSAKETFPSFNPDLPSEEIPKRIEEIQKGLMSVSEYEANPRTLL